MPITLDDQARQYIAAFEEHTDATALDCVVDDDHDRIVFVVKAGEMGQAIGPQGSRIDRLEDQLGHHVELVEDAPTPEGFVANALAPAAVYNVTISEMDGADTIAYAEVDHDDRGVAIGKDGRNIRMAKHLAKRHYDIDDIQLT